MLKKYGLIKIILMACLVSVFSFITPSLAGLETQLVVDTYYPYTDRVAYNRTQWYSFNALAKNGYCVTLAPTSGNSDLYLLDNNFNLVSSNNNTGTNVDKVWYGQDTIGIFHVACLGLGNPYSDYTVQVLKAPYIKTINLASGNAGTLITLTGYGFGTGQGASYVKFADTKAGGYFLWTNTRIMVNAPSGLSGVVPITVWVNSSNARFPPNRTSNPVNFSYPSTSSNGTMGGYDLARTGNFPDGPIATPLNLKWSFVAPYITAGNIGGEPVVAKGIVYVQSDGAILDYPNSIRGRCLALDAITGNLKWSTITYNVHCTSAPAVANGIVYVASYWQKSSNYPYNYGGTLYALDTNTGAVKWSFDTGGLDGSPLVENGMVYIGDRGLYKDGVFVSDGKVYALDAITGALKWTYAAANGGAFLGSPALANGTIYVLDCSNLIALDALTGTLKWKVSAGGSIYSTPVISNNIVYVNNGFNLKAYDAIIGILKWKYDVGGGYPGEHNSLSVSNGIVYVYFRSIYNLVALDANTGGKLWSSANNIGGQTPAISKNIVWLSENFNPNSKLYAFDAINGTLKWSYSSFMPFSNPYLNNGKVYVSSWGTLYCFGQ